MSISVKTQRSITNTLLASVTALALLSAPIAAVNVYAAQGSGSGSQSDKGSHGSAQKGSGQMKGKGGGGKSLNTIFRDVTGADDDSDDSDRPEWAGQKGGKSGTGGGKPATSASKKGDLFGDLWVILRDENGVPILTPEGWVQPLDADGNPIPLDAEGNPVDATLAVEVELGRLNVGRAPTKVLDRRADEVVTLLNQATDITLDAAGRLVLTVDGVQQTIDSPLENLAIYVALMTEGTIPGVTDLPGTKYDFMVDGVYTVQDLEAAKTFLAAATDKTSPFTSDEIAYIDAFLGINLKTTGDQTYSVVDYSSFTYDRSDTYSGVTTTVLVQQSDGTWAPTTINVYDTIFGGVDVKTSGTIDAFTQAAEDARQVINYIHEFAVPDASVVSQ